MAKSRKNKNKDSSIEVQSINSTFDKTKNNRNVLKDDEELNKVVLAEDFAKSDSENDSLINFDSTNKDECSEDSKIIESKDDELKEIQITNSDDSDHSELLSEVSSVGVSDDEELMSVDCPTLCLFCSDKFANATTLLDHCSKEHGFDIPEVVKKLHLNQAQYASMINYIRCNKVNVSTLKEHLKNKKILPWDATDYTKTVLVNDGLLLIDVTEDFEDDSQIKHGSESSSDCEITKTQYKEMMNEVLEMRKKMKILLAEDLNVDLRIEDSKYDDDCYNFVHIHKKMLQDKHRTATYINAINAVFEHRLRHAFADTKVSLLDVGCGTGILCLAAMRAAYTQKSYSIEVYGVDRACIIEDARQIAIANGNPYKKINFINGDVTSIKLPVDKVDIILSEWMGYGLFSECMLDSVIIARDRFLKTDGLIIPHQATLYSCLISNTKAYADVVDYWNDVYGFDMSHFSGVCIEEVYIDIVPADCIISSCETVKVIDVEKVKSDYLPFKSNIQFKINQTCIAHGLTLFFTADFKNFDHVRTARLSTAPTDRPTHWKQSTLYFEDARMVASGDIIECVLRFDRSRSSKGRVRIKCNIFDSAQTFLL